MTARQQSGSGADMTPYTEGAFLSSNIARAIRWCVVVAVIAWAAVFPAASPLAQFATGAVFDEQVYGAVPKGAPMARGNYAFLPPRVSLKAFAPTPGDQGRQGSCVGWASAYAARTLSEARRLEMTSRNDINRSVFSPAFIYNQIRQGGCDDGSLPADALELMAEDGVPLLRDFPYTDKSCSARPGPEHLNLAASYRIGGYKRLFDRRSNAKHVAVRRALANGNPVVIGMLVSDAFMGSGERYMRGSEDIALRDRRELGGHAMAVIGYDDTKFGGAFELINSWGTDWGNGGFVWVSYDDFNAFVMEGFEMIPPQPAEPEKVVDMSGSLRLIHISGKELQVSRLGETSQLTDPMPSGTRFRAEISSRTGGYIYVLGGDSAGHYVELFPRNRGLNPRAEAGNALLVPGPTEDFFTRLNDDTGRDHYVVLFSREPLDASAIAGRMNSGRAGPLPRLEAALGAALVAEQDITRNGPLSFEAASGEATVVPLIVDIEHVAPEQNMQDRTAPRLVVSEPAADELEVIAGQAAIRRISEASFVLKGNAQDEGLIQSVTIAGALSSKFSSRGPFEASVEVPADGKAHPVTIVAVDAAGNRSETTIEVQVAP
ncbi:Papain family cysteine protease [Pannonibacter phragmitetus]|uniref:Papain family cysteine protease n=1 Tax=Pannonibacter phragmitetus TaxID=121719 RepID=A0A378ZY23_9HYPH|nr:Papain family cysteine protease [Pannonibacter phragmitetus]